MNPTRNIPHRLDTAEPAPENLGAIRWLLEWFVFAGAWLVAAGWVLSAVRRLGAPGYVAAFIGFAAAGFLAVRAGLLLPAPTFVRRQFRWPRRWIVRLFACLLLATLVGAATHRISHFDTLSYRVPRILQYLAEGRWHWIHTTEFRMNAVSPGIEWLWTPVFAFGATERWVNGLGSLYYLFLPGLLFGVWRQSGVAARTAWWWCWVLPAGYCYAMQAGGPAVDLPGSIYTLAALDFALRAWRRRSWRHLCLSLLAVSLMGTLRLMCLPLGLVWILPALAAWVRRRPPMLMAAGTGALALACSFLPGGYFNIQLAGSFRGIPNDAYPAIKHPLIAIIPNFVWFLFQNIVPPVFPWFERWNRWAHSVTVAMGERFEGLPFWGTVERGASEQNAGLGCTVFLFFVVSAVWARRHNSAVKTSRPALLLWTWVTPWIALAVFAAEMGLAQSGRYLASYYPLLLTPFLARPGFQSLVRRPSWQRWAGAMVAVTLGLVVFSRQRPVWPLYPLIQTAARLAPGNHAIQKVKEAFARTDRTSFIEFFARNVPATEAGIGYYSAAGTSELDLAGTSYHRRVWLIDGKESADWLRERHIRFVVFEEWNPSHPDQPTRSADWLKRIGDGQEIARQTFPYSNSGQADIVVLQIRFKP
jgi:hypothetical protein